MDDDDYFVAMAYDNHTIFVTFASLDYNANLPMLINLRWLMTCFIVLNRWLMSPLALLKAIACLVVAF
jgi:hypothetical protein